MSSRRAASRMNSLLHSLVSVKNLALNMCCLQQVVAAKAPPTPELCRRSDFSREDGASSDTNLLAAHITRHLPTSCLSAENTLKTVISYRCEPLRGRLTIGSYPSQEIAMARHPESKNNASGGDVPTSGPSVSSAFTETTAELIYVEQYVPPAGDSLYIYWSGCNFFFGPRGGYAGIQHQNNNLIDGQIFTYNNICSIWDLADSPGQPEVSLDYGLEGLHHRPFGGEGTGLHTSHPMPWTPGHWYGMVIRRWFIPGESVTHMAMFMYSYTHDQWTHYMSASIPDGDVSFTGDYISGFLERFGGDALGYSGIYGQHFRMSKDGSWQKPTHYVADAGGDPHTWNATLVGGGDYPGGTNIKLIAGGYHNNDKTSIRLEPDQFDAKPKVVKSSRVDWLNATYLESVGAVRVEWSIPTTLPPQLSHRIEITKAGSSTVIASNSNWRPEQRDATFQTGMLAQGSYNAKLTITNIFNLHGLSFSTSFNVP
ncbi:DUF3472 domain-containing protein [Pseudomonas cichorii]|nr:DUF3472 domain-containing protein [Pseudomonas cichorii]MBX8537578.1 DUF3472 domain-containing protein [Pseudomonas cichorii]